MVSYRDFKLMLTWIFEKDTYMCITPIPILLALLHSVREPIYRHLRRRQWHPLQHSCLENPMDGGAW